MYTTKSTYCGYHEVFLSMDDDQMFYAVTVTVPFTEAKFWKSILWAEFYHLASDYSLKVTEAREIFNFVMNDLVTDFMTEVVDIFQDDLKREFLQRSRESIADAASRNRKRKMKAPKRAYESLECCITEIAKKCPKKP